MFPPVVTWPFEDVTVAAAVAGVDAAATLLALVFVVEAFVADN